MSAIEYVNHGQSPAVNIGCAQCGMHTRALALYISNIFTINLFAFATAIPLNYIESISYLLPSWLCGHDEFISVEPFLFRPTSFSVSNVFDFAVGQCRCANVLLSSFGIILV